MDKRSDGFVIVVYVIQMCLVANLCVLLWPYRASTLFLLLIGGFGVVSQYVADYVAFPPKSRAQTAKRQLTLKGVTKGLAAGLGVGLFISIVAPVVLLCLFFLTPLGSIGTSVMDFIGYRGQMVLLNLAAVYFGAIFGVLRLQQMQ